MAVILSVIGVAAGALCIWMIVGFVNRRRVFDAPDISTFGFWSMFAWLAVVSLAASAGAYLCCHLAGRALLSWFDKFWTW